MSYFQPPRGFFYRVDIEKDGVPSWPERYPMSYIEEKRELAKEQKKYSLFLQEYYNIPWSGGVPIFDSNKITVLEGARFDKYENITYLAYQGKKKLINVFIGVDPARSVRDDADDTCFFVIGVLPDGHYVILEVVTAKIKPSEQVKQLFNLADKYRPRHVEIEVNAYQFALADWCRQTMNATPGISFAIEEYTSSQSKNAKYIAGLEPIINTGQITRLGYCPGWEKLKEEMDRFDGERKDNSDNTLDGAFLALDQAYAPADRNVDDLIAARKLSKGSSPKKRLNWMTI
jgi:phage terminase large subunit-like protein